MVPPKTRPPPDDGTFEIGLVLAGAVSAGAYTAGVMDFLFEALDEWYRLRAKDADLPQHNVVLRVISGASAGGINGAIAAAACRYAFPPITLDNADKQGPENPFFNTWVEGHRHQSAARSLGPQGRGTGPLAPEFGMLGRPGGRDC